MWLITGQIWITIHAMLICSSSEFLETLYDYVTFIKKASQILT